jgi:adenylate cyclase class 2
MTSSREVEIKFLVSDPDALEATLTASGFRCITPTTHEINTLYDLPGHKLRWKGQLLRLRQYGDVWTLTHKARASVGRHKSRVELETHVTDGTKTDQILRSLGYQPVFVYEKFRAEWTDGRGHVVLDQTPIGNLAEIEGPPRWIDATAKLLGVKPVDYVTTSYAELFFAWKRKTNRKAKNMTFRECGGRAKTAPIPLQRVPRKPKPAPEFRPRRA